ncbi:adenine deaminase [Photobacterium sanctipauli]|uniref:Adenine deaminase n=1 Tax=Photobacterium sanctipauli TaxID=1342794 RepID=A0A2T3NRE4_9GAMM|nr:adenine deaminase C-terminal domain-containing protein [Photobacterium sanctipauli]PSW18811.1 adenine deaminase [Photobacterium sanctipauli]
MRLNPKDMSALVAASMGRQPVELLLTNVQVVNLFTGEIHPGQVGVQDGFIAYVDMDPDNLNREDIQRDALEVIDGQGRYLIPGFIDAHLHIESTMMTPQNFAKAVLPWGTTTVVTDPHEVGNVLGTDGVKYMAQASADMPIRNLVLAPSCVPALPGMESAGATFNDEDVISLCNEDNIFGIGEVMDFLGVLEQDDRMNPILVRSTQQSAYIQGHAPSMFGQRLNAYLCTGPTNDHETRFGQEAKDKMRLGMYVQARESSMSRNVRDIVEAVKDFKFHDYLCLCTDDREAADILEHGHMNHVVKVAIEAGLDPITAIRCATLHTAKDLEIRNLGAVAPGYVADLLLVDDLHDPRPAKVISQGKLVAENGHYIAPFSAKVHPLEEQDTTAELPDFNAEMLTIQPPVENGSVVVNVLHYLRLNASLTEWRQVSIPVVGGKLVLPEGHQFVMIQNRYGKTDQRTLAVVSGSGLEQGAIAATVSHDSHNLTVMYDTPENALAAIEQVKVMKGGIACANNGQLLGSLALPVAGLMSTLDCQSLAVEGEKLKEAVLTLGFREAVNPLLRIATIALPVIPKAKLSDKGLINVETKSFVPLFPENKAQASD